MVSCGELDAGTTSKVSWRLKEFHPSIMNKLTTRLLCLAGMLTFAFAPVAFASDSNLNPSLSKKHHKHAKPAKHPKSPKHAKHPKPHKQAHRSA